MKSSFWPVLVLVAALSLPVAGCATTGDPKAGGLFGWSEAKAKERQAAARAALAQEEKRGENLRSEKQSLQNRINVKKKELSDLKKKSSGSSAEVSEAEAAEVKRLEKEIEQLNQEALVLMDL